MKIFFLILPLVFFISGQALSEVKVVTSIKPIHSLVANIMKGSTYPKLIVDSSGTPHHYNLKPSQVKAIQNADLIIWVSNTLEGFLKKPIEVNAKKAKKFEILESDKIKRLKIREKIYITRVEDTHHDEHKDAHHNEHHHDHSNMIYDPHIWLDTGNAKIIVKIIAEILANIDPENENLYRANELDTVERIKNLESEIQILLEPVKDSKFIATHDAYYYIENQFNIDSLYHIVNVPEDLMSASTIRNTIKLLETNPGICLFTEPGFDNARMSSTLNKNINEIATLDPSGSLIASGPDHYFEFMTGNARTLNECLKNSK
tara:strand:+ start:1111 stop:2064 length:954 start_codon:yes stop_codon:yes gene_type:complete